MRFGNSSLTNDELESVGYYFNYKKSFVCRLAACLNRVLPISRIANCRFTVFSERYQFKRIAKFGHRVIHPRCLFQIRSSHSSFGKILFAEISVVNYVYGQMVCLATKMTTSFTHKKYTKASN